MSIERINIFFMRSEPNWYFRNSAQENGGLTDSQTQVDVECDMVKAFVAGANAFPIQLASVPHTQGCFKSEFYGWLTTTFAAGLLTSS